MTSFILILMEFLGKDVLERFFVDIGQNRNA